MEFPFGHNKHHHHHKQEEEEEEEQYPPPRHQPDYRRDEIETQYPITHQNQRPDFYPPPPPNFNYSGFPQQSPNYPPQPPPPNFNSSGFPQQSPNYPPQPVYSSVRHVSHGVESPNYPPQPAYSSVQHVSHGVESPSYPPQPAYSSVQHVSHGVESPNYPPQPAYSSVQHVSHETQPEGHHRHNPFSSAFHHISHENSEISRKPTVRVFCRAESNYSLSIRDGKVVLARADPKDDFQHWFKDEKYSTRVKDEESFPSFALVNKATGQALKHSVGATKPVQLTPYNPNVLDASVLWTESKDTGNGFRAVRMVNNIRLNLDAFHGDKDHGGVRDGTILVLWEWAKGDNQKWKIVPY
ncbi:uncharacterized protein LOC143877653 [Tasmannia lanceolata]|uniref:uncharacterized protein LOC143877653 n=1 Tax=Tasmannia lanceolata TaxID=3420 RepID=UPI004064A798